MLTSTIPENLLRPGILDSAVIALLGYSVVFLGLIALMVVVIIVGKAFAAKGVEEFIIIAQDTTRYGEDIYGKRMLPELLREICKIDGIRWIRILYAYPERVTEELLDVMASEEKIVKYLDIPLRHCSKKVLKAMYRKQSTPAELLAMVKHLRERVPGITLRTTLLTGFPGESDSDFEAL